MKIACCAQVACRMLHSCCTLHVCCMLEACCFFFDVVRAPFSFFVWPSLQHSTKLDILGGTDRSLLARLRSQNVRLLLLDGNLEAARTIVAAAAPHRTDGDADGEADGEISEAESQPCSERSAAWCDAMLARAQLASDLSATTVSKDAVVSAQYQAVVSAQYQAVLAAALAAADGRAGSRGAATRAIECLMRVHDTQRSASAGPGPQGVMPSASASAGLQDMAAAVGHGMAAASGHSGAFGAGVLVVASHPGVRSELRHWLGTAAIFVEQLDSVHICEYPQTSIPIHDYMTVCKCP